MEVGNMLNLINVDRPITVNGVEYANSREAYEKLKGFEGKVSIIITNGDISRATPKKKGSLLDKYNELTGEELQPVEVEETKPVDKTVYRIKVKKWMTEPSTPAFDYMKKWNNDIPMPLMIMKGTILDETRGMLKMELHATPEPSSHCFVCGRPLSHPVSILYGIGPECGGHFHINPLNSKEELDQAMDDIRVKMSKLNWTGWIAKSAIKEMKPVSQDEE